VGAAAEAAQPVLAVGLSHPLVAEASFVSFLRRVCVRHCDKLLIAANCALCIVTPSVLGFVLLSGTCISMLCLGGPHFKDQQSARIVRMLCKASCGALVVMWLLSEYTLCTPWVSDVSGLTRSQEERTWLSWAGMCDCQVRTAEMVRLSWVGMCDCQVCTAEMVRLDAEVCDLMDALES
jgi:hypothetical protein